MKPCVRCGVVHAPEERSVVIRDPDDEAVACGALHLERMSGKHVWLAAYAADGRALHVNLHSRSRIDMHMEEVGMDPAPDGPREWMFRGLASALGRDLTTWSQEAWDSMLEQVRRRSGIQCALCSFR